MNRCFLWIVLIVFSCVLTGCGQGVRVSGKVSFSDGQPLTVGKVMFTNGSVTAFGTINKQGEYRMGMLKNGDGIPLGNYKVYITEALQEDSSLSFKNEEGETIVPLVLAVAPKYTNPAQSGLICDVKGAATFDIQVEKPGKGYNPLPTQEAVKQILD